MRINNSARKERENKRETWMLFSSSKFSRSVLPLHRLGCCGRVSIHYFLTWPTFVHPFIAPRIFRLPRAVRRVELPWLFLISLEDTGVETISLSFFLSFFFERWNEKIKKNEFLELSGCITVLIQNFGLENVREISKFFC